MFAGTALLLANLRLEEIQREVAQQRGQRYEESKESEAERRRRVDRLRHRQSSMV